ADDAFERARDKARDIAFVKHARRIPGDVELEPDRPDGDTSICADVMAPHVGRGERRLGTIERQQQRGYVREADLAKVGHAERLYEGRADLQLRRAVEAIIIVVADVELLDAPRKAGPRRSVEKIEPRCRGRLQQRLDLLLQ